MQGLSNNTQLAPVRIRSYGTPKPHFPVMCLIVPPCSCCAPGPNIGPRADLELPTSFTFTWGFELGPTTGLVPKAPSYRGPLGLRWRSVAMTKPPYQRAWLQHNERAGRCPLNSVEAPQITSPTCCIAESRQLPCHKALQKFLPHRGPWWGPGVW